MLATGYGGGLTDIKAAPPIHSSTSATFALR